MQGVEDGTHRPEGVRISDLGAPLREPMPARKLPVRPRRSPLLAVVGVLALTGAAYSATAAVPPLPGLPAPGMPARYADAVPAVPGGAGVPLDGCSVHPGACPSPPGIGVDGTPRFLPDGLTGTTGSVIICEPSTGACRPLREEPDGLAPGACDVVESLRPGLARLPQEVAGDIDLPEGQDSFLVVGPGGVLTPVGIQYDDGTIAVCGPLDWPYTDGGTPRTQHLPADEELGGLDDGESYAYRTVPPGQLELMGVRLPDGAILPQAP